MPRGPTSPILCMLASNLTDPTRPNSMNNNRRNWKKIGKQSPRDRISPAFFSSSKVVHSRFVGCV
ncbi:jordan transposition protein [Corchorus olitorius]|uniref:Jordan transposition protein n=1 Tax=Corchorus olitorius TaxID=93759 RepID=A0A1R3IZS2_9ROSI|nr:jordan transposition protein [Corchorus olitorius]